MIIQMDRNYKFLLFLLLISGVLFQCNRNRNRDGERLYKAQCMNCHQESGQGLGKLIPPLTDSKYLMTNRVMLPCILQNGMNTSITINGQEYNEKMPGIERLSDADLVNILNYIGKNWGNDLENFTIKEIIELRKNCDQPK